MDALLQVLGAAIITLTSGAAAYQIRSNKAQEERIDKIEETLPEMRSMILRYNDVVGSQLGYITEKITDLQQQRREVQKQQTEQAEQLNLRLNHLDALLSDLYSEYLKDKQNRTKN
jgi:cell shape-determining protein MreC